MMRTAAIVLLLSLVAGVSRAGAQQTTRVSGVVRDTAGHPIPGVVVSVAGSSAASVTGASGAFHLVAVPTGAQVVRFQRLGFRPAEVAVQLGPAQEAVVEQTLIATAAELGPVKVEAKGRTLNLGLEGFEERRKSGRGQFVTAEEFQVYSPRDVEGVLRNMHSLRVADTKDGPLVVSTRGLIMRNGEPAMCALRIGVDGTVEQSEFTIDEIGIDNVAAIEVYAGPATIPPEFNSQISGGPVSSLPPAFGGRTPASTNGYCGLVMIWTRH